MKAWLSLCCAVLLAGCAALPSGPVVVKVIAINDFHGNLHPPLGGIRVPDPSDPSKPVNIPAGGAAHLATAVAQAKAKNPNHIFVAAGDLIGATPLVSALFRDEPTIESLSLMGLEVSAVGNHEFDRGAAELLRLQRGGCHPQAGCTGPAPFTGARFNYLAASTVDEKTGTTILPAVHVKRFQGIPVAFIGLTLADTPNIVVPAGVAGLRFRDEAQTVNELVPRLRAQGIEAIVLLIHEGGMPATLADVNACPGIAGPIVEIVGKLDRAVDLVVSGHTHRAYNCRIGGRLVTSADRYGTLLSEIDLTLDAKTGDVIDARADNVIVRSDRHPADAQQAALIAAYERLAAPLAKRVVAQVETALTREETPAGETAIGRLVADAQLADTAGAGAQIALMNPGGLRAALAAGQARYEDLFAVQPFWNNLVTLTLSGAQLLQALEEQWLNQPRPRILQVSRGFAYAWDASRPVGQRVVPGSAVLNGRPIDPGAFYRVTVNSFLAGGGDSFTVFKLGSERRTGRMDIDAFEAHLARLQRVVPPADERIRRVGAP